MYDSFNSLAVISGNYKRAALFFDRFYPTRLIDPEDTRDGFPEPLVEEIELDMYQWTMRQAAAVQVLWDYKQERWRDIPEHKMNSIIETLPPHEIERALDSAAGLTEDNLLVDLYCQMLPVPTCPIYRTEGSYNCNLRSSGSVNNALEIVVTNNRIVDTSNLSWEQIREIRANKEMIRKLRNFRLFLHERYEGQDRAYILDSLNRKMEEYQALCKKHGLELVNSTVKSVLDSKSALCIAAITTAGVIAGENVLVAGALLSGLCIEIGKLSVTLSSVIYERRSTLSNHELAFLFAVKGESDRESTKIT